MKKLSIERTFTRTNKEWYQLFGEEATAFFKQNCHWIPWKFTRLKIERAWSIAQKEKDNNFTHFMNNLHKS